MGSQRHAPAVEPLLPTVQETVWPPSGYCCYCPLSATSNRTAQCAARQECPNVHRHIKEMTGQCAIRPVGLHRTKRAKQFHGAGSSLKSFYLQTDEKLPEEVKMCSGRDTTWVGGNCVLDVTAHGFVGNCVLDVTPHGLVGNCVLDVTAHGFVGNCVLDVTPHGFVGNCVLDVTPHGLVVTVFWT